MAGIAGKNILGGKLKAIIALDPAGPLFTLRDHARRVASTDAWDLKFKILIKSLEYYSRQYVEVIHTNGAISSMYDPIGQADFYPNFGRLQPGCGPLDLQKCPHKRAVLFFAESIAVNNNFVAHKCASFFEISIGRCTRMSSKEIKMGGEPPNSALKGVFHLSTNNDSPYGKGWLVKL